MHKSSETMIAADVLFNLPATEQCSKTEQDSPGRIDWESSVESLQRGGGDEPCLAETQPVVCCCEQGSYRDLARRSRRLGWEFDCIIPCHGGCD